MTATLLLCHHHCRRLHVGSSCFSSHLLQIGIMISAIINLRSQHLCSLSFPSSTSQIIAQAPKSAFLDFFYVFSLPTCPPVFLSSPLSSFLNVPFLLSYPSDPFFLLSSILSLPFFFYLLCVFLLSILTSFLSLLLLPSSFCIFLLSRQHFLYLPSLQHEINFH